jgi:hypothetical protein
MWDFELFACMRTSPSSHSVRLGFKVSVTRPYHSAGFELLGFGFGIWDFEFLGFWI